MKANPAYAGLAFLRYFSKTPGTVVLQNRMKDAKIRLQTPGGVAFEKAGNTRNGVQFDFFKR